MLVAVVSESTSSFRTTLRTTCPFASYSSMPSGRCSLSAAPSSALAVLPASVFLFLSSPVPFFPLPVALPVALPNLPLPRAVVPFT